MDDSGRSREQEPLLHTAPFQLSLAIGGDISREVEPPLACFAVSRELVEPRAFSNVKPAVADDFGQATQTLGRGAIAAQGQLQIGDVGGAEDLGIDRSIRGLAGHSFDHQRDGGRVELPDGQMALRGTHEVPRQMTAGVNRNADDRTLGVQSRGNDVVALVRLVVVSRAVAGDHHRASVGAASDASVFDARVGTEGASLDHVPDEGDQVRRVGRDCDHRAAAPQLANQVFLGFHRAGGEHRRGSQVRADRRPRRVSVPSGQVVKQLLDGVVGLPERSKGLAEPPASRIRMSRKARAKRSPGATDFREEAFASFMSGLPSDSEPRRHTESVEAGERARPGKVGVEYPQR